MKTYCIFAVTPGFVSAASLQHPLYSLTLSDRQTQTVKYDKINQQVADAAPRNGRFPRQYLLPTSQALMDPFGLFYWALALAPAPAYSLI